MSEKYFLKSSVMDKGRLFSLTLILIVSPKIKKLLILPKLCSFLLLDHNTLYIIWTQVLIKSLFWLDRSTSSVFVLHRSFFTVKTCWQSFLLGNLMMTGALFLLTLWQVSVQLEGILQPNFLEMFTTFSSKGSASTSLWMSIMSRHSCLECWALA